MAIFILAAHGCQRENLADIRFCADIRANDPCIGEDTVFLIGNIVWAQLLLSPGFKETAVIKNSYGYKEGESVFIESRVHELSEGQNLVVEAINLNYLGDFEVEFLDTKKNALAKKCFEI